MHVVCFVAKWSHRPPRLAEPGPALTPTRLVNTLNFILVSVPFQASFSLPGSPFVRRNSRSSWKKVKHGRHPDRQPLVPPYLENLNLPYADDSTAVTPCSDELCNLPIYRNLLNGRRSSFAAGTRRAYLDGYSSRRSSYASQTSRTSRGSRLSPHSPLEQTKLSKLENLWNISKTKGHHLLPEVVVDRTKSEDNVSSMVWLSP